MILLEHFLALHIEGYSSHLTGYKYFLIMQRIQERQIFILNMFKNPLLNPWLNLTFEHIELHSFIMT